MKRPIENSRPIRSLNNVAKFKAVEKEFYLKRLFYPYSVILQLDKEIQILFYNIQEYVKGVSKEKITQQEFDKLSVYSEKIIKKLKELI